MFRRLPGWLALVLSPIICGLLGAIFSPTLDSASLGAPLGAFLFGAFFGLFPGFLVWYTDRSVRRELDSANRSRRATTQASKREDL